MPSQQSNQDLIRLFRGLFDYQRGANFATPSGNYFWYRKRLECLKVIKRNLKLLNDAKGTFVDLGCGDGTDLFAIRQLLPASYQIIGIDAEPAALQICKLKAGYYEASYVEFIKANLVERLPLQNCYVDFIYCSEVIEHLADPESFLEEIRRILKPGGLLLLTTPNEPNIFQGSYWRRGRRKQLQQVCAEESRRARRPSGESVDIHGHISLKAVKEWDALLKRLGFTLKDYARGGIVYGGSYFYDLEPVLSARFLLEAVFDLFPRRWTRSISDQLIALYQVAG